MADWLTEKDTQRKRIEMKELSFVADFFFSAHQLDFTGN